LLFKHKSDLFLYRSNMNFFEQQDRSRNKSTQLILLFGLGVTGIVVAVYLAAVIIFFYANSGSQPGRTPFTWFHPELFLWVALATLAVIIGGSLIKIKALRRGGSYVAESLGGRGIHPATTDPRERVLVNVVEEMALASGVPVPMIYVLDNEAGINAFAAGYTYEDAVVAVTRGCLEQLNRDELQGVVAHEFSHILNGDMRLNLHLIGMISGILVLAVLGRILLHSSRRSSRSSKGSGGAVMLGLALLLIGYIGVFVSRMLQSAISRQREYLSDASAIQFTRNPTGIANALKKIGGFSSGTRITSPAAEETGHMFFGNAVASIFATHPPIVDRIQRIDPSFSGDFTDRKPISAPASGEFSSLVSAAAPGMGRSMAPEGFMSRVGTLSAENIAGSAKILDAIPAAVREDLRDPFGASCVIYTLLLDSDAPEKNKQMAAFAPMASDEVIVRMAGLEKAMAGLAPEVPLALLDLALPALRQLSPEQYERFKRSVQVLVQADGKITLFEFVVQQIITHRLDTAFLPRGAKETHRSIEPLVNDAVVVLSKVAAVGHADPNETLMAFNAAMKQIPVSGAGEKQLIVDAGLDDVGRALSKFAAARPGVKRVLLDACAHCVLYDKTVTASEAELLRAVAYALDLPLPPMVTTLADRR
jgi:Zn-dependent protease with chaperone function